MSQIISKDTSSSKTYKDATLQIASRTIASQDYVMQISNISQASVGNIPKKKASVMLIVICAIVGLVCMNWGTSGYRTNVLMVLIGLGAFAVIAYHVYTIYKQTQQYGLTLELNSGNNMFFTSEDRKFLRNVLDLIDQRMQEPGVHQEIYVAEFARGSIDQRVQNIHHSGSGAVNVDSNVNNQ